MKRSLLSFALALAICLGLLPSARAAGGGACGINVGWSYAAGVLTISGSGPMDDFSSGSAPWYPMRGDIQSIQVGGGVTHIGAYAFLDCLGVASVQLADSVASIGDSAFAACGTSGLRITLPRGLTTVGRNAFLGCNMGSVTIPTGVSAIEESAFSRCVSLTQAAIPGTVTRIAPYAFDGCASLTSVSLPAGVSLGDGAFRGLPASAVVTYGGTQDQWDAIGAARNTTTAELVFGVGAGSAPKVQCQGSAPRPSASLVLDGRLGSDGVVEINAGNPKLSAAVTAPVGAKLNSWELRLYTQSGSLLAAVTESRTGVITQSPAALSITLWKTPNGPSVVYSDFSLDLGAEYGYSFSAVVDGESLTTERGRFRLGPALRTYTVEFCNPINMTYSKSIQVVNGQTYGKLPTPAAMPGKTFAGWYTAGGERITESTVVRLTQNQTLFARWSEDAPITLTHASVPGNGGVVELSAQNPQLTATLSAPVGKRLTRWEVNIYQSNGTFVGRVEGSGGGVMGSASAPLALTLWTVAGAPKPGQSVDYGSFQLTIGTVYDYEFTAVVEGVSCTSSRARFRLAAPGQTTTTPAGGMAYTSTQIVMVDGKAMQFQMYALKDARGNDTNYIKLRDLAYVLNGTRAQFDVTWNGAVNVETGRAYRVTGEEMRTPFSGNRAYEMALSATNVNGSPVNLTAILLKDDSGGGYTYYQLRDLGRALGFNVGWEAGRGIFVETDKPYAGQ